MVIFSKNEKLRKIEKRGQHTDITCQFQYIKGLIKKFCKRKLES